MNHTYYKYVTFVVPTFREAENIPELVQRIKNVVEVSGWKGELLIMDDNSQDGSEVALAAMNVDWATLHIRKSDRGLSRAVLDGLQRANGDYVVVLDADLSHPPETVPDLIRELDGGADFALGSRYVNGGSTDDDWGVFRWLNSRIATLMARPLTHLKDPMSGFFAMHRKKFNEGKDFNPIGYKIALELIVKCQCRKCVEVPIHFVDRRRGESKLSFKEQLRYIQHLRRLMIYKYGTWSHLFQFLVVGGIGAVVNLCILTIAMWCGLSEYMSVAAGILVSFLANFSLNRRFTFSYARHNPILKQFVGYASASIAGALVNYIVTVSLYGPSSFTQNIQLAAFIGIVAAAFLNFISNRYLIFRTTHIKKKIDD